MRDFEAVESQNENIKRLKNLVLTSIVINFVLILLTVWTVQQVTTLTTSLTVALIAMIKCIMGLQIARKIKNYQYPKYGAILAIIASTITLLGSAMMMVVTVTFLIGFILILLGFAEGMLAFYIMLMLPQVASWLLILSLIFYFASSVGYFMLYRNIKGAAIV